MGSGYLLVMLLLSNSPQTTGVMLGGQKQSAQDNPDQPSRDIGSGLAVQMRVRRTQKQGQAGSWTLSYYIPSGHARAKEVPSDTCQLARDLRSLSVECRAILFSHP